MLSRKYYIMIAKVINSTKHQCTSCIDKDVLIDDLCIELKADNCAFNRDTFISACNGE